MILPIDDKWRIKSDAYCYHLQKFKGIRREGKNAGEQIWVSKRYYNTIGKAVYGLVELELMTGDTTTLEDALDAVQRLSDRLSHALTPHIEIID